MNWKIEEKAVAKSLNALMNEINGKTRAKNVLDGLAIRSMAKAKYTNQETHTPISD